MIVAEQVVPELHSSTGPGKLRSSMVMKHGVGPTSAFVVAVRVTDSPSNTAEALARQDKVWAHDPDGLAWEYYTVLEHIETP